MLEGCLAYETHWHSGPIKVDIPNATKTKIQTENLPGPAPSLPLYKGLSKVSIVVWGHCFSYLRPSHCYEDFSVSICFQTHCKVMEQYDTFSTRQRISSLTAKQYVIVIAKGHLVKNPLHHLFVQQTLLNIDAVLLFCCAWHWYGCINSSVHLFHLCAHIDGLEQNCSNPIANTLVLPQSCT